MDMVTGFGFGMFFVKQKTAYEMRISDWSSDVCSSDLAIEAEVAAFLPQAPAWLATDPDDQAIGFMLIDGAHMEALFIDPAWRGKGVGRQLVDHALSLHPTLTTDVNEQNAQAIGFYEAMRFARTGRSDQDGQGRPYPQIGGASCRERVGQYGALSVVPEHIKKKQT